MNLVSLYKKEAKKSAVDWAEVDKALKEIVGESKFKTFSEVNKIRLELIKILKSQSEEA